jgi:hypothetical protein
MIRQQIFALIRNNTTDKLGECSFIVEAESPAELAAIRKPFIDALGSLPPELTAMHVRFAELPTPEPQPPQEVHHDDDAIRND